ncbi:hypothetical protein AGMMS49936_11030 [Endomicrobiia bacterium]|nr:hypothetical protein AGMMS49936_11030 [Endomicrobiia bacterium]
MSIEKIVKIMFEYFRAIPEHIIRLRQNTYKHTNPKKRDQRSTQKLTKEDKEFNQRSTQKLTKEDKELNR